MTTPNPAAASTTAPAAPAPAPAPVPGAPKPVVAFDDFAKLDLRVAKILKVENHPNADKLYKLQLDDGSGTPRQICAGIRAYYKPEELLGQRIVIIANLAPRVIRGEESRGMLLAASNVPKDAAGEAERRVVILSPLTEIEPGAIVS
jgi:methionyl-tRNA synthetase